jgi:hypothetical protein
LQVPQTTRVLPALTAPIQVRRRSNGPKARSAKVESGFASGRAPIY